MPRIPRKLLIDPTEVGVFHCLSRCVRRAFLCGADPLSGKNFDHRKAWLQERLAFLAGQFGIDVLGFAVMSNHLHVILRNRPDVVAGWTDDEVARRWWNLFPLRRDDAGNPAEPEEWELSLVTGHADRLAEVRGRLSSLSWFMRCVAEPIARRANREDACTGRFWEGRYKCQPLLDEAALTACLAYVDLNPIRAGIAATPETSRFTSVFERIAALREGSDRGECADVREGCDVRGGAGDRERGGESNDSDRSEVTPGAGLVTHGTPIAGEPISEPVIGKDAALPARPQENQAAQGAAAARCPPMPRVPRDDWLSLFTLTDAALDQPVPASRASNTGCLPMPLADYLDLLDWTGRQLRPDKRGAIPEDLPPILQRLSINGENWLALMQGFSRIFRRAAGRPDALRRHAEKWGRQRSPGLTGSQAVFG